MAAIAAVSRLAVCGDEIIVNDDSYGGTYRLMSQVATQMGIKVTYIDMAGHEGTKTLKKSISSKTRLVMIESPTNPLQKICNIRELSAICHANNHSIGTLLSIDNTILSLFSADHWK